MEASVGGDKADKCRGFIIVEKGAPHKSGGLGASLR